MITVIEDKSGYIDKKELVFISEYKDYITTYSLIQKAIKDNVDLTIVVKISLVKNWIEKMSQRYDPHLFVFKSVNYKTILQEKWDIKIPNNYDTEDLEELKLLDLDAFPKQHDKFEDFILSYFYDPVFSQNSFRSSLIGPILKSYDSQRWENNKRSKLLRTIFAQKIQEWQSKIKEEYLSAILKELIEQPEKFLEELVHFKVLRTELYHSIANIVFRDKFEVYKRLKLNLKDIDIDYKAIEQVSKQAEIHLHTLKPPSNTAELESLISSMSGLLPVEFSHIERILKNNPNLVNNSIISQLKIIFSPIYNAIGKKIEKLKELIVPMKPKPLQDDTTFEIVKDWLLNEYLPYQSWLVKNNYYDEDFLKIGDSFSEWLYNKWEDISFNSNALVCNWLYNNSRSLQNNGKVNIILIIDNLCYSYSEYIQTLFADKEISVVSKEPYYAMVPSETEISKKCLLSGKSSYNQIDQNSYTEILNKGWIPYFEKPENFIYVPNIDEFEKLDIQNGKSYFINYLAIDIVLHQEQAKLGLSHDKQIKTLLAELIERVVDKLASKNLLENSTIHVISDHGSALFHKNTKNDIDIKAFKKKTSIKISDRYIFLTDEEYASLPDNLKIDCFFLDKNRYGLPYHCLCARRGNTFKEYASDSFLHGGLLPEEIIVPNMKFEKISIKVEPIIINLLKNKFRYKAEEIELQIENPNSMPVENIQIKCLNSNVESLPGIIEWLDSNKKIVIKIKARFRKTNIKEENEALTVDISYLANRKTFEFEKKLEISMVSMVELKDTTMFD